MSIDIYSTETLTSDLRIKNPHMSAAVITCATLRNWTAFYGFATNH
jgi:hypothetical protein